MSMAGRMVGALEDYLTDPPCLVRYELLVIRPESSLMRILAGTANSALQM
jgi:hypothetical protein